MVQVHPKTSGVDPARGKGWFQVVLGYSKPGREVIVKDEHGSAPAPHHQWQEHTGKESGHHGGESPSHRASVQLENEGEHANVDHQAEPMTAHQLPPHYSDAQEHDQPVEQGGVI